MLSPLRVVRLDVTRVYRDDEIGILSDGERARRQAVSAQAISPRRPAAVRASRSLSRDERNLGVSRVDGDRRATHDLHYTDGGVRVARIRRVRLIRKAAEGLTKVGLDPRIERSAG